MVGCLYRMIIAPVCAKMRQLFHLPPLATTTFSDRPYDLNLHRGFSPVRTKVTLTPNRASPKRTAAPRK